MRDRMSARGPDGFGDWIDESQTVGLGHRRLAIIELTEAGAQPMHSADGRYTITFNGEIYNYKMLREALVEKGYAFASGSDTEVLLHLFADKGEDMVRELRGMFAFAIWDNETRSLFLARDPYGIKPLYYSDTDGTFRFSSQVKSILASGQLSLEPDPAGWAGFYMFGSVPEPFTTYLNIKALPAGHTMRVTADGVSIPTPYHSLSNIWQLATKRAAQAPTDNLSHDVRTALLDSVRHHLVADVPVGAFLSAGIDSGALVGLMRDAGQSDIQTVTLTYEEFVGQHDDEAPLAEKVSELYSTKHTTRIVTEAEFHEDLPLILDAMDQPTIDGINTWFVSKAAKELGLKVVISGLGGDELFGGYPSFREIPKWVNTLSIPSRIPFLGDLFKACVSTVSKVKKTLNPKTAGLIKYGGNYSGAYLLRRGLFMPWELADVMGKDMAAKGLERLKPVEHISKRLEPLPDSAFGRVASLESSLYMRNQLLRDSDWAGMAHSLELRVPLVDPVLLETIAPLILASQEESGKEWLGRAPKKPLPDSIINRKKTGFSIPVGKWLQKEERAQAWRDVEALQKDSTPWARRWAYCVASHNETRSL